MPIPHLRSGRSYGKVERREEPQYRPARPPRRAWQPKLPRLRFNRAWIRPLLTAAVVLAGIGVIGGTIAVAWISKDLPDPNKITDRQVAQSTKIYDRTGEHLLYEVYQSQKRTIVELDQVNPLAVKAIVAIEDKYFYEHKGVRIVSIIRAGINNLLGRKSGGGGASTITQQVIKNTIVGDEHSYFRKIKEAILALRLERKYTKDEILKMYLNEIPLGSTNYGIEAAAQSYFRKKSKDITAAEAATLAAMLPRPTYYLNNLDALRSRRDVVLRLMHEQGFITEEEKNEAQNAALRVYRNNGIMDAPHFVLYVKQLLADKYGEKTVDTGGLKVITTLDYDKQKIADAAVKELGDKFAKDANANNAALVSVDPKTGQILAMVGSRDFENEEIDGQFNVAVLGLRQPGSSLKPFIYTYAFERGYTPETATYDIEMDFDQSPTDEYKPRNYDKLEHGLVTFRKALQGSLNIPAVKVLYLLGAKETIEFAKRFGYTTLKESAGLSLVLGGSEVNLLEHTNAYATLANNGVHHAPVSILKVTNGAGDILEEWKESEGSEAVKPEIAATISNVLSDDAARAYIFGRGSTLTLTGRTAAAKTGTTNDYKDAWTMGYTPSLAAGVWVGNTKPSPMKGGGNTLAGQIWQRFMKESLTNTPAEKFPDPPASDTNKPILNGADGGLKVRMNRANGKLATSSTPERMIVERVYLPPHDILHYVRRDDPRGPAPENPADDPQYLTWEEALVGWVEKQRAAGHEVTLEEPPTETDPGGDPALSPTVEILTPAPGGTETSRDIEVQVKASAPRGVTRVSYYLDGRWVGESRNYPFSVSFYAHRFDKGEHTLIATAEDDMGNAGEGSSTFTLDVEPEPADIEWADGEQLSITKTDFPRPMGIIPYRWDDIKDIKITLTSAAYKKLIFTFNHTEDKVENGVLSFTWKTFPGAGTYTLTAEMMDNSGRKTHKDLIVEVK